MVLKETPLHFRVNLESAEHLPKTSKRSPQGPTKPPKGKRNPKGNLFTRGAGPSPSSLPSPRCQTTALRRRRRLQAQNGRKQRTTRPKTTNRERGAERHMYVYIYIYMVPTPPLTYLFGAKSAVQVQLKPEKPCHFTTIPTISRSPSYFRLWLLHLFMHGNNIDRS